MFYQRLFGSSLDDLVSSTIHRYGGHVNVRLYISGVSVRSHDRLHHHHNPIGQAVWRLDEWIYLDCRCFMEGSDIDVALEIEI